MSDFDGKVVLITGCGRVRGIGRAIAVAFACIRGRNARTGHWAGADRAR